MRGKAEHYRVAANMWHRMYLSVSQEMKAMRKEMDMLRFKISADKKE